MNSKMKMVLNRIKGFEQRLVEARESLESGNHVDHKDWIKNFFIPSMEKALNRAEKALEILEIRSQERRKL